MTGIGPIAVRCPRVRDRVGEGCEPSAILPPYARRSKSFEVLIPILYLKGVSTALRRSTGCLARQGCRRAFGPQALAGAVVDHDQDAYAATVDELIGNEVERQAVVRPLRAAPSRGRACDRPVRAA